jgi:hypothetical protein
MTREPKANTRNDNTCMIITLPVALKAKWIR